MTGARSHEAPLLSSPDRAIEPPRFQWGVVLPLEPGRSDLPAGVDGGAVVSVGRGVTRRLLAAQVLIRGRGAVARQSSEGSPSTDARDGPWRSTLCWMRWTRLVPAAE